MMSKWILTLIAAVPFTAGLLVLQSCGGEGGPKSGSDGLPGVSAQFLALLSDNQKGAQYIGAEACGNAACHGGASKPGRTADDPIYTHWKETTHATKGVTCERCHGPGSRHQADPEAEGLILTFPKVASPVVCAQCHGPLANQFNLSGHNLLIAAPVEEGIQNPAQYGRSSRCITCHSGLVRIEESKGVDVGAMSDDTIRELCEATLTEVPHIANCATCHNPHSKTGNVTDTGEEKQLRKQTFNNDTAPIGPSTTATSFTTYNHICAQCHNGRGADGRDAKLLSGTARPNMHDSNQFNMLMGVENSGAEGSSPPVPRNTAHSEAPGQCSKCHMPDSNHSFKVSYDKSCAPCHTAVDAATRIATTRNDIVDKLLALRTRMSNWSEYAYPGQEGNDIFWEYTSTITAEGYTAPAQGAVPIAIKRARHNYYFVIRSGDYGAHNAPYARYLITVANENIDGLGGGPFKATRAPASNLSFEQKLQILKNDAKRAREIDMRETGEH